MNRQEFEHPKYYSSTYHYSHGEKNKSKHFSNTEKPFDFLDTPTTLPSPTIAPVTWAYGETLDCTGFSIPSAPHFSNLYASKNSTTYPTLPYVPSNSAPWPNSLEQQRECYKIPLEWKEERQRSEEKKVQETRNYQEEDSDGDNYSLVHFGRKSRKIPPPRIQSCGNYYGEKQKKDDSPLNGQEYMDTLDLMKKTLQETKEREDREKWRQTDREEPRMMEGREEYGRTCSQRIGGASFGLSGGFKECEERGGFGYDQGDMCQQCHSVVGMKKGGPCNYWQKFEFEGF